MKLQARNRWRSSLVATVLMSLSLTAMGDSARAFVPMGTADSVGVIDLESYQITSTISGTINTHGSALTPDGRYLGAIDKGLAYLLAAQQPDGYWLPTTPGPDPVPSTMKVAVLTNVLVGLASIVAIRG